MEENLHTVKHVQNVKIGENGRVLYLERPDGEGIAIPIDDEIYHNLEDSFLLTENPEAFIRDGFSEEL